MSLYAKFLGIALAAFWLGLLSGQAGADCYENCYWLCKGCVDCTSCYACQNRCMQGQEQQNWRYRERYDNRRHGRGDVYEQNNIEGDNVIIIHPR